MTTIAAFYLLIFAHGSGSALAVIPMATGDACFAAAKAVLAPNRMNAMCIPTGFKP